MPKLEEKLRKNGKKSARIIVETFPFPHLKPIKKGKSTYLYTL
jgi:hypothetical protein